LLLCLSPLARPAIQPFHSLLSQLYHTLRTQLATVKSRTARHLKPSSVMKMPIGEHGLMLLSLSTTVVMMTTTMSSGYMGDVPMVNSCAPPSAGASITLTAASAIPAGSYVTFVSGLAVVSVQGTISGNSVTVVVPSIAAGQTYVFVSNSDVEGALVDSAVLFGPAIVEGMYPSPPCVLYDC
jgi:hypothetical protein